MLANFYYNARTAYGIFATPYVQLHDVRGLQAANVVIYGEASAILKSVYHLGQLTPTIKDYEFYIPIRNSKKCCDRQHLIEKHKLEVFGCNDRGVTNGWDGIVLRLSSRQVREDSLYPLLFPALLSGVCVSYCFDTYVVNVMLY